MTNEYPSYVEYRQLERRSHSAIKVVFQFGDSGLTTEEFHIYSNLLASLLRSFSHYSGVVITQECIKEESNDQ